MGACDFWYEPPISHSPCGTFFPWHGVIPGIPVPDQTRGNYRMHGPLRRLAASHVELTTWIGGPGLFLHFFHAMHAQTRTVFCDPNRLFLGPYGKKSRIRTTDLLQKTSLSYRRSCFFGRFFRRSYVWGGVGSQSPLAGAAVPKAICAQTTENEKHKQQRTRGHLEPI